MQSSSQKINQRIKFLKLLFFFFNFFRILNEQLLCLAKKFSAGISKLKVAVIVSKDQSKIQIFESSLLFQNLQKFERTFTVLGVKLLDRYIKIEFCTLCLQSIILRIKTTNFRKFCEFSFISDVEHKYFGFVVTQVHAVWRNCILGVYLKSLWDVGIRSEITWKEIFFESSVSFSNSSEIWTNIYCAWQENFRPGYQNWKLQPSSQKINKQSNFWNFSFFFQILQNFERTITVLGEKVFGRDIKIESCSHCIIRSIKNSNFWKLSSFSNSSELYANMYRAGRKFSGQEYHYWKVYSMSSEYLFEDNKLFWNFCKFSFISDLEHEIFGFVATEFSPGLSKWLSSCVYEFSSRCWY